MHFKRILSALVAIPLVYLLTLKGGPFWFSMLVTVAGLIALSEYYRIMFNEKNISTIGPIPIIGYISCVAVIQLTFHRPGHFDLIVGVIVLNFLLSGITSLFQYKKEPAIIDVVTKQVHGIIYIPVLISSLILLRGSNAAGISWVFFILVLVAACDTGAYYAGTYLGKHKLCPSVSPGKTIEGFIGGMIATLAVGLVVKNLFFTPLSWSTMVAFLMLVATVGPCGDLFESVLKRTGGIKDSGAIIPGHGGMLDRIDALLFVAPVAYLFQTYIF